MNAVCSECNICTWLPEQKRIRLLLFEKVEFPLVLVIDDLYSYGNLGTSLDVADDLLGGVEYTYTSSIRCEYKPTLTSKEDFDKSLSRCSVWTNQLLKERLVILSTLNGLKQIGHPTEKEGIPFISHKYGYILPIPPLLGLTELNAYKSKTQRLLKRAKLIK